MRIPLAVPVLPIVFLSCCSLEQRIADVSENIHHQYAEAKEWEQLPLRVISWEQAVAMMMRCNSEIADTQMAIEEAERDSLSIYTDMIPGVSYYGYFTKSIKQLSDNISANDLNTNVNVTFSIPTLTQVPYRVYAAKAKTFAAVKAREGKERELTAKLYTAVHTRRLQLEGRELETKNPNITEQDRILSRKSQQAEDAAHWQQMCELLGDYSARWVILPSSAPKIKWSVYSSRLNRMDDLVVCAYALRLEQARLAQYQVALRYLPTINTSLYSPSLFSSSGGTYQGSFLSGEDTRINLSLSYSFDTNLSVWNSYQRNKAQYEKVEREVQTGIIEHKNKLTTLKASMAEYHHWRSYMLKRIEYLQNMPVSTAEELITRDSTIFEMRKELIKQAQSAVESEAALIMEYGLIK